MTHPFRVAGAATQALSEHRGALAATAAFSGVINLLGLSAPLFMLQVYDRVLASRSLPTLLALVVLVVVLLAFQGGLELVRTRIFGRVGALLDRALGQAAVRSVLRSDGLQAGPSLRDVEQVRAFLASGGPSALFDLPWTPLYLALLFLLHPWLGLMGLAGAGLLAFLTLAADRAAAPIQQRQASLGQAAQVWLDAGRASRETTRALGMVEALQARWAIANQAHVTAQLRGVDVMARYSAISKFVRLALQSLVLAAGALLIIDGKASGGVMIASSILLGKTLAPVDQAIAHWRGFVAARQALGRLDLGLPSPSAMKRTVDLPTPVEQLRVENLTVTPPGASAPALQRIDFCLEAGDVLGVIGPSGSGKTTLLRALAGLQDPDDGSIRLDGSTLDQWDDGRRGGFIGYVSQSIDLLSGSIAQNIARFNEPAQSESVLRAATAAGLDLFIRKLDDGFDSQIGDQGRRLSAGQRQRLALARALYGDPFLLILDEPNSALDVAGEAALASALRAARDRGAIVVMSAHRTDALSVATKLLALEDGRQKAFGSPGLVMAAIDGARADAPRRLTVNREARA